MRKLQLYICNTLWEIGAPAVPRFVALIKGCATEFFYLSAAWSSD